MAFAAQLDSLDPVELSFWIAGGIERLADIYEAHSGYDDEEDDEEDDGEGDEYDGLTDEGVMIVDYVEEEDEGDEAGDARCEATHVCAVGWGEDQFRWERSCALDLDGTGGARVSGTVNIDITVLPGPYPEGLLDPLGSSGGC